MKEEEYLKICKQDSLLEVKRALNEIKLQLSNDDYEEFLSVSCDVLCCKVQSYDDIIHYSYEIYKTAKQFARMAMIED